MAIIKVNGFVIGTVKVAEIDIKALEKAGFVVIME